MTLVLPDGAVLNTWLRVAVRAGSRTGLAAPDVFYFGNLVGDTAGAGTPSVNAIDVAFTRANFGRTSAMALNRFDFKRDGVINASDLLISRTNQRRSLPLFTAPVIRATAAAKSAEGLPVVPSKRASTRPTRRGLLGESPSDQESRGSLPSVPVGRVHCNAGVGAAFQHLAIGNPCPSSNLAGAISSDTSG